MAIKSIFFGNSSSSLVTKNDYRAALKDYKNNFGNIYVLEQVHGIDGVIVDSKNSDWGKDVLHGDYLITNQKDVWLGVLTADCMPIVFFDPEKNAVAIAHAGWRGTVGKITQVVVQKLVQNFSSNPKNLQILFGPAARTCCYEVGQEFLDNLSHDTLAKKCIIKRENTYFFDVSHYNVICLAECGVPFENIDLQYNICTICDVNYCSYRRLGSETGLQISMVALR